MKSTDKIKNVIIIVLAIVTAAALGIGIRAVQTRKPDETAETRNTNVTLVQAPEQDDFEPHPEWKLPEPEVIDYGENLALGKSVTENGHTQVYHCRNVNDEDTLTYWEGRADDYPNELTIDMEESLTISGVRVLLNPRPNWGTRKQEIEVQISSDNENFTTVYPKTTLTFDPQIGNYAYMEFDAPADGQYVKVIFYSNTGAAAGQAAEVEIYAPQ